MRVSISCLTTMLFVLGTGNSQAQTDVHRFSARDSIEMTSFSSPAQILRNPQVSFAPDGSKFLVVTSRGDIATNEVHSDLWVYDVQKVREYIGRTRTPVPLQPRHLVSNAAVPRAFDGIPYAALITELHWSSDSRTVYFLGESSDGIRHLYRVNTLNFRLQMISPSMVDVREFDISESNAVVFWGSSMGHASDSYASLNGIPVNKDARVVTGLSLQQILFPSSDNGLKPRVDSLWLVPTGSPARVLAKDSILGAPDVDIPSTRILGLSPNGRYVVCILPVESIPLSWSHYEPMPTFEQRRIDPSDPIQRSPFNLHRVRAYFLIDTKNGHRTKLVDAPSASRFAFHDTSTVQWDHQGHTVIVTNTFLPDDSDLGDQNQRPCAALWINLDLNERRCIVHSRDQSRASASDPNKPLQLTSVRFDGADSKSVLLHFGYNNEDVSVQERYVLQNDKWRKVATVHNQRQPAPLSITIQQDLNTPPTLWAKDPVSGDSKELWDPNPQLQHDLLGTASVYQWIDESGRNWIGGLVLPVHYDPSKRYPLVIQTHGFEPAQFLSDGEYPTAMAARPLASAGMVVLQMGYTYDHVLTMQELDDQLMGYRSAVERLVRDGIVDRSRVGIIGFSRPAWHVASALENAPDLFAAATLVDGTDMGYMQDMLEGEGNANLTNSFNAINGGSPIGANLTRWMERAVPFHLDKVRTPVRIEALGPVSLLGEWEKYASLRQQAKPVDLIYIPNGQHILQSPLDRLASQEGNVAWFCFWLVAEADQDHCPVPPKDEMKSWIQMRAHTENTENAR